MNLTDPAFLAIVERVVASPEGIAGELQLLYPGFQEGYYYHMALAGDKAQKEGRNGRQWTINMVKLDWLDLRRGNTNTEQQRKDEDYFG